MPNLWTMQTSGQSLDCNSNKITQHENCFSGKQNLRSKAETSFFGNHSGKVFPADRDKEYDLGKNIKKLNKKS